MQRFTAEHAEFAEKYPRSASAVSGVSAVGVDLFAWPAVGTGGRITGMTGMARASSGDVRLAADVAIAAQLACLIEASAPKPGNVSPGRHFADARYEDFLASAAAIGAPLAGAGTRPVGSTVRLAVEATARWTRSNSNLGIVLLLAPIARAALGETVRLKPDTPSEGDSPSYVVSGFSRTLRDTVRQVLEETTVDD